MQLKKWRDGAVIRKPGSRRARAGGAGRTGKYQPWCDRRFRHRLDRSFGGRAGRLRARFNWAIRIGSTLESIIGERYQKTRAFCSTDATRKKLEFLLSAHHCENRKQSETVQQPDIALATMS